MAALPYMQLYVADYLADTCHLNAAQHGAYLLLLMNYWQRGKSLPDSNDRLASVARMSNEEWTANREVIAEFFRIEDSAWIHDRVERDLQKVKGISNAGKIAGLASAKARKQKTLNDRSTTVPTIGQRNVNHTDTDTDTDTDKKQKKQKTPRGKREVHPLFAQVKDLVFRYYEQKNGIPSPWDAIEATNLSKLLNANPTVPIEHWTKCLKNRFYSDVSHGDRPGLWLSKLSSYTQPLNEFNRPKTKEPPVRRYLTQ